MSDFSDLEKLAVSTVFFPSTDALSARSIDYSVASLDEILDLLATVAEPYKQIQSTLPQALRQSAQDEIQFFRTLLQQRLGSLMQETGLQPPPLAYGNAKKL